MKIFTKTNIASLAVSTIIGASMFLIGAQPTMAQDNFSAQKNIEVEICEISSKSQKPKYIFAFLGDGMSHTQINSAQIYQSALNFGGAFKIYPLSFTEFPYLGNIYTQDSTSFSPDSASTATSLLTGEKTHSGVIGLGADKITVLDSLPELLKEDGYKIGIVSTVTLNHATPAASYAHNISRDNYYDIGLEMATSNFDYFAGGNVSESGKEDDEPGLHSVMIENGYTILQDKEDIMNLNADSGKVYAITPGLEIGDAMPYSIDHVEGELTLVDHVANGIKVLDNEENGFFMWIESGKIDWAGHANDARTNIDETIAFDEAVQEAINFYNEHPDETLIIVTGDHETGGMTIGQATTGYDTAFELLEYQTMSYDEFDLVIEDILAETPEPSLEDIMPVITENFGLGNDDLPLADYDIERLEDALVRTVFDGDDEDYEDFSRENELYGGYLPLTVTLTHILNEKAGVGWTSYSHTGSPVPVYAIGVGAQNFAGTYDNTDIFHKLAELTDVK
ncbi:MAG: alkaline phosphatase [Candidatus Epulonipiscioides saccharophilum]|nr:MAG: alkaline phosphatase [Epulopiscium sp. AS2M-Bin001]